MIETIFGLMLLAPIILLAVNLLDILFSFASHNREQRRKDDLFFDRLEQKVDLELRERRRVRRNGR